MRFIWLVDVVPFDAYTLLVSGLGGGVKALRSTSMPRFLRKVPRRQRIRSTFCFPSRFGYPLGLPHRHTSSSRKKHLWFFRGIYLSLQIRKMSKNISVFRQIVVEHSGFEPLTSTMRM